MHNYKHIKNDMKKILPAIVAALLTCATLAHAQTGRAKKQSVQQSTTEYESSDDTLPGKHKHSSWFNMQTTFEGKEYKFVEDEGKVVLLYVDGERIPDDKISQYSDVITRIKKQMEEQRKLFEKQRIAMRQMQENFRDQQRQLMDQQRELMHQRDSTSRALMADQREQFRARDTLNRQLYRQRQELYQQQQEQYRLQREQFKRMRDSSGYADFFPMEPTPPMEPMAPVEPFVLVAPHPTMGVAPAPPADLIAPMAPLAPMAPIAPPPMPPMRALPAVAVAPFADVMLNPMPVVPPGNKTIRDILDYLEDKDVKIDEDNVSFSLNNTSLTVNGVKQPDALFAPLKKRYVENSKDHITYSTKKDGSDRTTQTNICTNSDSYSHQQQVSE